MHDLNVINKLNAEACATHKARELVSYNKHVVVEHLGAHAIDAHGFATFAEAQACIEGLKARNDSSNGKYLAPRNAAAYPQPAAAAALAA